MRLGPQRIVSRGVTLMALGGVWALVIYQAFGWSVLAVRARLAVELSYT
ncbi:hypothetical protein [Pseudomonas rhodesiae]